MSVRRTAAPILFAILAALVPGHADAQWFAAAYLGANATASATVSVEVPAEGLALDYHDVGFDARPFESPQYYGIRAGRLFGTGQPLRRRDRAHSSQGLRQDSCDLSGDGRIRPGARHLARAR